MWREIYNLMACNTESLDRIKLLISLTHYFATSFGFLYLAIAVTQVKQTTLYTIKLLFITRKIYHFRGIGMLNFKKLCFYMSKSTLTAPMCRLKIKFQHLDLTSSRFRIGYKYYRNSIGMIKNTFVIMVFQQERQFLKQNLKIV